MADKPVLFSGSMVRALIAGTKVQTRRGNHLERLLRFGRVTEFGRSDTPGYDWHFRDKDMLWHDLRHTDLLKYLPWQSGDRLWVRESFSGPWGCRRLPPRDWPVGAPTWYWADGEPEGGEFTKPKPGMHMPRWASRITINVTDVRVERLQEISEEDARAEGVELAPYGHWKCYGATPTPFRGAAPTVLAHGLGVVSADAVHSYATLWDSINGEGEWDSNPWVAAYTFAVHHGNVDMLEAA